MPAGLLVTFCDLDVGENQMTFGPNNNIGIESIKANDRSQMLQAMDVQEIVADLLSWA